MSDPKVPEVGDYVRMTGTLLEVIDVPPLPQPPPQKLFIFKDCTATVEIRVNGLTLKTCSTYNNFNGRDACVRDAICEAKELVDNYGTATGVEVCVVKETFKRQSWVVPGINYYCPEYVNLSDYTDRNLIEDEVLREKVWSSLEDNEKGGEND